MSTIKCSKCAFRGAQTEFARKPNLGYMKTCSRCTERKRNAAAAKRQDVQVTEKDGSKRKRQTLGNDRSPQGLPMLTSTEEVDIHGLGSRDLVTRSTPSHSSRPSRPSQSDLDEDSLEITEVGPSSTDGVEGEREQTLDDEEDDFKSDEEGAENKRVFKFYSEAEKQNLKQCFENIMSVAERTDGVHPKMAAVLNSVFDKLEKAGDAIRTYKRRKYVEG